MDKDFNKLLKEIQKLKNAVGNIDDIFNRLSLSSEYEYISDTTLQWYPFNESLDKVHADINNWQTELKKQIELIDK